MTASRRPLAIVTGASTGIGLELARRCAEEGFDLVIAADEPEIRTAAHELALLGGSVEPVQADLSTLEGVDALYDRIAGREVDALFANAGRGLGNGFLDQDFTAVMRVVNTNITGTIYLVQKIGRDMRRRGEGRILITGSIAGFIPGAYHAVYNASKAFIDSFSIALRSELKGTGVTVTCLMPGATDTAFFARAGLLDTRIGQAKKDDASEVAEIGYRAMMNGDSEVVSGWHNKVQSALASITPATILAEQHRKFAEPGGALTH
mgnify:CR=1 FL=1